MLLSKDYPSLYKEKFFSTLKKSKNSRFLFTPQKNSSFERKIACLEELKKFELDNFAEDIFSDLETKTKDVNEKIFLLGIYKKYDETSRLVINSIRIFYRHKDKRHFVDLKNIFPKDETDMISSILDQFKVDSFSPTLVLSLIRQESAFNMNAVSVANATGLMQLLPSTAKEVAKRIKLKKYSLYDPKDNIILGVNYLKRLQKRFSNNIIYALSSYNAGPTTTRRWIKQRGNLKPQDFIETIPYKETSLYVKLIARNYVFYQLLYNEEKNTQIKHLFLFLS